MIPRSSPLAYSVPFFYSGITLSTRMSVEKHRGIRDKIISRLDNGASAGLIYSLMVLTD